jgi:hypothetical protein
MKIQVHIDRLVLENMAMTGYEQHCLKAAIAAALDRRLAEVAAAPSPVAAMRRNAAAQDRIARLGEQIAQAVYGGIRNE